MSPVATLLLDRHERITRVNRAARSLLGSGGSALEDTLYGDHVAPEGRDTTSIQNLLGDRDHVERERTYLDGAGGFRFVRETLSRFCDEEGTHAGFIVQLVDHTEHQLTLQRLERYQLLSERARDIMLFVDAHDGRIVEANDAAVEAYGYPREQLLGMPIRDLRAPDTLGEVATQMHRADEYGLLFETRHRRRDGTTFPVEVSSKGTVDVSRRILLSIVRDISERKTAEEALRAAMETAERLARSKAQFLANMSHELRTPLTAILGFGRVLERETYGPLNDRQRGYIDDIVQSGEHMLKLVNDLLDLRRIEEGRQAIDASLQDARPSIDEAIRMVRPLAQARSHQLVLDITPGRLEGWIDQHALVQILVNLLGNAVKFTPSNGRISFRADITEQALVMTVEDNGIGIAESDQGRLFRYFEQANTDARRSGTGIGLALTHALVSQLGGTIGLESKPGEGSRFSVRLRRVAPP